MVDEDRRDARAREALDRALREEPGRVLSVLAHAIGDIDLAEDALHDAGVAALERWPLEGVPSNPAGWLVTTAKRKAIDRLRRVGVERRKHAEIAALTHLERDPHLIAAEVGTLGDERLSMTFACCHPGLSMESRVALTLRTVGGLSTAEIARAFLASEPTMKQRVTRAKRTIREAPIPLTVPSDDLLEERLPGVLAVLYLIFNEGYVATAGSSLTRVDLSEEAVRLTRVTVAKLPSAETLGLLALMLFHTARMDTRHAEDGALVPLADQDRTRWDQTTIQEANGILAAAATAGELGPYQLQAAIASIHANASRSADTKWHDIVRLYDGLVAVAPSTVFLLNRAVAFGMANGPASGLEQIDALDGLDTYHLFHAARADMLRRLGRSADAEVAYRAARRLAENGSERLYLERRIHECRATH